MPGKRAGPRLGAVQRAVLARLASSPQGMTAPELADLSWGSTYGHRTSSTLGALKLLAGQGLVVATGKVPRPHSEGRGAWAYRWVITRKGRRLVKELGYPILAV